MKSASDPSLQVWPPTEEGHAGYLVPLVPGISVLPVEPEPHPSPVVLEQLLAVTDCAGKVGRLLHSVQDVGNVGRLEV